MTDKKTTPAKYECSECGRQEETKEGFDIDNNPHIVGCPASDNDEDRCKVDEIPVYALPEMLEAKGNSPSKS